MRKFKECEEITLLNWCFIYVHVCHFIVLKNRCVTFFEKYSYVTYSQELVTWFLVVVTKSSVFSFFFLSKRVDEFFHKDINYVITSNRTSRPDKQDTLQSPESPSTVSTPSPFNCGPSPSPASGSKPPPESVSF